MFEKMKMIPKMVSRRKSLASYYSVLELDSSASHKETKSAFLRLAQKHHPDKGGDEVSFQLIQNAYSKIIAEQPSEKKEKANRLVLSKFGPTKNDECVIGNDQQFQKRRNDIYELVRSMSKSCPGRWEMAGHGFIQFVKCNPGMVHGFTEFYTFYLSRVNRTKMGVILELEDFMAKSTHYVNLYDVGDYSYTINDDDDLFLDLDGLNKSVYVARDIPFTDSATGSHYVIDDLLTFLNSESKVSNSS